MEGKRKRVLASGNLLWEMLLWATDDPPDAHTPPHHGGKQCFITIFLLKSQGNFALRWDAPAAENVFKGLEYSIAVSGHTE